MDNKNKYRILYLYQYLITHSDSEHPISTSELIQALDHTYSISVNRNTISKDLDVMIQSGLHIYSIRSTQRKYYYDGQLFDDAELKVLMDAIISSQFITQQKSQNLIARLLSLTTQDTASRLRRHLQNINRAKSTNEQGYYIVDTINDAIDRQHKISFQYMDYDIHKEKVLRHDGQLYVVSPYSLIWNGDYYYLIGFCDNYKATRTFRLDRIFRQPDILDAFSVPAPDDYDPNAYNHDRSVFRMYDTHAPISVTLSCKSSMMNYIIDQFGIDVDTKPIDEDTFLAYVSVCTGPTFFRWVFGWGGKVRILAPSEAAEQYHQMVRAALQQLDSDQAGQLS